MPLPEIWIRHIPYRRYAHGAHSGKKLQQVLRETQDGWGVKPIWWATLKYGVPPMNIEGSDMGQNPYPIMVSCYFLPPLFIKMSTVATKITQTAAKMAIITIPLLQFTRGNIWFGIYRSFSS